MWFILVDPWSGSNLIRVAALGVSKCWVLLDPRGEFWWIQIELWNDTSGGFAWGILVDPRCGSWLEKMLDPNGSHWGNPQDP